MSVTSPAQPAPDSPATTFRLKGGLFPLTALELTDWEPRRFLDDLRQKVAEAPAFFRDAPVILDLDGLPGSIELPLQELVAMCRQHGLLPVGVRGGSAQREAMAREAGLACLPASRSRGARASRETAQEAGRETPAEVGPATRQDESTAVSPAPAAAEPASPSRVVTTPVRSGQQVYAAGGDLIVLSSVSEGAEVLADGNIHVYGPLRGRALAGVRGDARARIFCQSLEAELVSIAGDFKLHDDLQGPLWKQAVQISLDDQTLKVDALV